MVTAPKISLCAALCSAMKKPNRRTPPRRRTLSTKTPSTPTTSAQIAADPCGSSSAFFPLLGDATLPRRHFAATRHETGFDDLHNDHASPKPLVAVAVAGDEAVRPRMGQGRQDPRRRPFSTHSARLILRLKRPGAVHRHAKRQHRPARKNTIPINPAARIPPRLRSIRLQ